MGEHKEDHEVIELEKAPKIARTEQLQLSYWGRGDTGQSLTSESGTNSVAPVVVHQFDNSTVVGGSSSECHSLVVTRGGDVYGAGSNHEGQLVHTNAEDISIPLRLDSLGTHSIVQVACGLSHTVCLTSAGLVVSFGLNEFGQLGHSPDSLYNVKPRLAPVQHGDDAQRVMQVACCENSSLFLSTRGQLFTCGFGGLGALGHGDRENQRSPRLVEALALYPISRVAAGGNHAVALVATGSVFAWGHNKHGQLGVPPSATPAAAHHTATLPVAVTLCRTPPPNGSGSGVLRSETTGGSVAGEGGGAVSEVGEEDGWAMGSSGGDVDADGDVKVVDLEAEEVAAAAAAAADGGSVGSLAALQPPAISLGELGDGDGDGPSTTDLSLALAAPFPRHTAAAPGSVYSPRVLRAAAAADVEAGAAVEVAAVECGQEHTLFVTTYGEVFTCGRNQHGQLGQGSIGSDGTGGSSSSSSSSLHDPRVVEALRGVLVSSASVGGRHSTVLTRDGHLYAFGAGESGQLGVADTRDRGVPTLVTALASQRVLRVMAGGDGTMAVSLPTRSAAAAATAAAATMAQEPVIMHTTAQALADLATAAKQSGDFRQLRSVITQVFSHPTVLNASFLLGDVVTAVPPRLPALPPPPPPAAAASTSSAAAGAQASAEPTLLLLDTPPTEALVGGGSDGNTSSGVYESKGESEEEKGWAKEEVVAAAVRRRRSRVKGARLDALGLERAYVAVLNTYDSDVLQTLLTATRRAIKAVTALGSTIALPASPDQLRIILIALSNPLNSGGGGGTTSSSPSSFFQDFVVSIARLPPAILSQVAAWAAVDYPPFLFHSRLVLPLQQLISRTVTAARSVSPAVAACAVILGHLFRASQTCDLIPAHRFYNEAISALPDGVLVIDYRRWVSGLLTAQRRRQQQGAAADDDGTTIFSFCGHAFLLNADAKRRVLQLEAQLEMQGQLQQAMFRSMFRPESPFFVLRVRRAHLVRDALTQIASAPQQQLQKPLRVVFDGEEGVDAGGVRREFFQLLLQELLRADYGLFTVMEDNRVAWFSRLQIQNQSEFVLIGALFGLAIYNRVLLDVKLPLVFFQKLLGHQPADVADVARINPGLARGLQQLLDYDGDDVEDVFCQTFEASLPSFGGAPPVTVELKPGGSDVDVTNGNREEYVRLYCEWYLHTSVASQFEAFKKGFRSVLSGPSLLLFAARELEQLITGTPELDFHALQRSATYDGGYTAEHPEIQQFWQLVHRLPLETKKKLLRFTTGCARGPIGGLGKLAFKIQRDGIGTSRLPTSHTCFNTLLLPEYGDAEVMERKLLLAIEQCEGFGLE